MHHAVPGPVQTSPGTFREEEKQLSSGSFFFCLARGISVSKDFTVLTPNITVTMHAEFGVNSVNCKMDTKIDTKMDIPK